METEAGIPRVGRPRLPTELIVETALQLIDEQGADALSMRSLAQRLNSSTATIYRHFPNRTALMVAVIDRVIGEIECDDAKLRSGDWRQAMRRVATDYFAAMSRHPEVALLLADHTPIGPKAMTLWETWLSAMLQNGMSLQMAARVGGLTAAYVQGFAIRLAGQRASPGSDKEAIAETISRLDPADYPSVIAVLGSGAGPIPLEELFIFGLDLILDGIRDALDQRKSAEAKAIAAQQTT